MQGQATDIAIQAEQIVYMKRMMAERIAFHTGQPLERIEADSDRDRWFTAEEANDYGFIDRVIEHSTPRRPPAEFGARRFQRSDPMTDVQSDVGAASAGRNRRLPDSDEDAAASRPASSASGNGRSQNGPTHSAALETHPDRRCPGQHLASPGRVVARPRAVLLPGPQGDQGQVQELGPGVLVVDAQPALTLAVFFVLFTYFLPNGIPTFVIYMFSAMLVWNLFQTAVLTGTSTIVSNAAIVKKVAFPREILPLASVGSAFMFFLFQSIVLLVFMFAFWHRPDWSAHLDLDSGAGRHHGVLRAALAVFLSAVNVYLRDTQHLVEVILLAWFWAIPGIYASRDEYTTTS